MLSLKQQENVCLLYTGGIDQCRYLKQDDTEYDKWYCIKKKKAEKDKIDKKINEVLADFKKRGIDPANSSMPLGDNCDGYPVLKHIEQGYDVD